MITNVYIDGFNLYYRALKDTPFRWLDLRKLAGELFPDDDIRKVHYFTALLQHRPSNPAQPQRQQAYLRALETLPNLEIHYGELRYRTKRRPLTRPVPGLPEIVEIEDWEEKGSDVNLATRLLVDGFNGDYEQAVVVSNDSDLAGPIRYVRDSLRLRATVVNPDYNSYTQRELESVATRIKRLWKSHLRRSLFASSIADAQGKITKPPGW